MLRMNMLFSFTKPLAALAGAAGFSGLVSRFLDSGSAVGILLLVAVISLLLCLICTVSKIVSKLNHRRGLHWSSLLVLYICAALIVAMALIGFKAPRNPGLSPLPEVTAPTEQTPATESATPETEPAVPGTEVPETEAPTEPVVTEPPVLFAPAMTDSSNPENFGIKWDIIVDEQIVDSYLREEPISFGSGADYFALPGIATFRGGNYRDNATYGTADVQKAALTQVWSHKIGSLDDWGGCAWTGQPLVVQWDAETRAIMNLKEDKKNKDDLVEVIYATLDGQVHFFDLADGKRTRDPINIGMNFKGAGALDPRGYPLLYVGSGLYTFGKVPRMFVVSLIDGSILYQYGPEEKFEQRDWIAFDSSPLVDAETDTLIWPGESGILYTIKLNTEYDKAAGTVSVTPDTPVKTRYASDYSKSGRYQGYESSASIVENYLYVSENGGLFYCVDLNTMELVWAQDTKDDSNSSPVFEWGEDGNGYLYTAPSLHWTAKGKYGTVSMYKLNAQTGEIVWEVSRDCATVQNVSGGVQATPILGKAGTTIEDMVIYIVARAPSSYDGVMLALDRETGEVIWEVDTVNYAWSSPVAIYTEEGKAYIAFVNASGKIRLVDGETGKVLYALGLDQTTEASPVVFGNMMVLGTREGIYGIKIS